MSATALEKLKTLSTEETFKVKSKAMALNLLDECYDHVTNHDQPAPFAHKLDMLKTAARFGDLEPKQNVAPIGVGFSIRVVYSGTERGDLPASGSVTIDQEVDILSSSQDRLPQYMTPSLGTDTLASLNKAYL